MSELSFRVYCPFKYHLTSLVSVFFSLLSLLFTVLLSPARTDIAGQADASLHSSLLDRPAVIQFLCEIIKFTLSLPHICARRAPWSPLTHTHICFCHYFSCPSWSRNKNKTFVIPLSSLEEGKMNVYVFSQFSPSTHSIFFRRVPQDEARGETELQTPEGFWQNRHAEILSAGGRHWRDTG